ncbi:MAG TPA: HEPN domain-containing protein [Methanofastidiosum sp.]|nr:HEPN domain-containing protein [Methanofastidiosum sp.]HNU61834.1 HEPN domain-containing protein [Methanofastidiosum sp.]HOI77457.1 HEPN domain-containing protein [Methanofastidiosum sp.]
MDKLSEDYLKRAIIRYEVLNEYLKREGYAEVVREAQETVELLLKAVLLDMGLIVPTMHDVSIILDKNKDFLKEPFLSNSDKIRTISKTLRKEREVSFYGAEDFLPSEEYAQSDAIRAIEDVKFVLDIVKKTLELG